MLLQNGTECDKMKEAAKKKKKGKISSIISALPE